MVTARFVERRVAPPRSAGVGFSASAEYAAAVERAVLLGADAAVQLDSGLLVTIPTPAGPSEAGTPSHRVALLAPDGSIGSERLVAAFEASGSILAHPDGQSAIVELPMGQDGTYVLAVSVLDGELQLREILPADEVIPCGFNPQGTRLLLAPYPNDPEIAQVLTWPDLAEVAQLEAADVGAELGFGIYGCYVGDDLVVLIAVERGLVVADAQLRGACFLDRPGLPAVGDDAEIESVQSLGGDRIAVGLWQSGADRSVWVYQLTR